MPTPVFHIMVAVILITIFRDFISKNKFSIYYVFIAAIGGILPDLDFFAYLILMPFGYGFYDVHRTITHSLFFLIFILLLSLASINYKKAITSQKLKLSLIFLALAFGIFVHLTLDFTIQGQTKLLSPLSGQEFGLNLISGLSEMFQLVLISGLEGVLVLGYFIYLEFRYKISNYI